MPLDSQHVYFGLVSGHTPAGGNAPAVIRIGAEKEAAVLGQANELHVALQEDTDNVRHQILQEI